MLTNVIFGSYCVGLGAISYNLYRIKMMDDFERQIRDLREFDFHNEELRQETDKKKQRAIVLAHYDT